MADRLNEVGQRIESYQKAIAKLEHQLLVKKTRLTELNEEKMKLEEGVDW